MNTYIMDSLSKFKSLLSSDKALTSEIVDLIIDELEMMKMEIEQHITNMPQDESHKSIRYSAQNAIQKFSKILDLLEELPYDRKLLGEILELVDEVSY